MAKKAFTIVLEDRDYAILKKRAEGEDRPVAQMARLIIQRALRIVQDGPSKKRLPEKAL